MMNDNMPLLEDEIEEEIEKKVDTWLDDLAADILDEYNIPTGDIPPVISVRLDLLKKEITKNLTRWVKLRKR